MGVEVDGVVLGELLRFGEVFSHLMACLGCESANHFDAVYLFSSGFRRQYREDVFNTLAYPPGFVIQFRYREPWVDDRIQDVEQLEGMTAVVVASPKAYRRTFQHGGGYKKDHHGYNYYPLRRGKIIKANDRGGSIHVHCKLGPLLVEYPEENNWGSDRPLSHASDCVAPYEEKLLSHPGSLIRELEWRPRMSENVPKDAFISMGPNLDLPFYESEESDELAWVDQEDEWVRLVEFLAEDDFFEGDLFYRLIQIRPIRNTIGYRLFNPRRLVWDRCRAVSIFKNTIAGYAIGSGVETVAGYVIDGGGQYRMDYSLVFAGQPPDRAQEDKLVFDSPDLIETFPSNINLGFRTDERSIIVDPSSTGQHRYSAIEVFMDSGVDGYVAPRLDIKFDLYPTLARRVGVYFLLFLGVVIVVAAGFISGWLSTWLTQNVTGFPVSSNLVTSGLTILGLTSIMLAYRISGLD